MPAHGLSPLALSTQRADIHWGGAGLGAALVGAAAALQRPLSARPRGRLHLPQSACQTRGAHPALCVLARRVHKGWCASSAAGSSVTGCGSSPAWVADKRFDGCGPLGSGGLAADMAPRTAQHCRVFTNTPLSGDAHTASSWHTRSRAQRDTGKVGYIWTQGRGKGSTERSKSTSDEQAGTRGSVRAEVGSTELAQPQHLYMHVS